MALKKATTEQVQAQFGDAPLTALQQMGATRYEFTVSTGKGGDILGADIGTEEDPELYPHVWCPDEGEWDAF